jgi:hypothetical protein
MSEICLFGRNRLSRVIVFAGVAAVIAVTPTAVASTSGGCHPRGARTIVQDAVGRFYLDATGSWYYCAFGVGTPHLAAHSPVPDEPAPVDSTARVSGRFLAFFEEGGNAGNAGVVVFDMVAGDATFGTAANEGSSLGGFGTPSVLVLKPDGSVAWIYVGAGGQTEVHRHDKTGSAIVDSGSGIPSRSLAAGGALLYWTDAGSPRSVPFH